jgi:hypothetical protein
MSTANETEDVIVPVPGLATRTCYPMRNLYKDLSSKLDSEMNIKGILLE